ncbi:MAG TPA: hypothetical protein VGI18_10400 [Burkholderiales bacterium]|jgi:hypothetical protein
MKLTAVITACLLAASPAIFAQTPPSGDGKPPASKDERRAKMKAAHEKAAKACEGQKGAAHEGCMRKEFCASAKDPGQCEARAKEGQARRDTARQACKDKKGDDYKACMREQMHAGKK